MGLKDISDVEEALKVNARAPRTYAPIFARSSVVRTSLIPISLTIPRLPLEASLATSFDEPEAKLARAFDVIVNVVREQVSSRHAAPTFLFPMETMLLPEPHNARPHIRMRQLLNSRST